MFSHGYVLNSLKIKIKQMMQRRRDMYTYNRLVTPRISSAYKTFNADKATDDCEEPVRSEPQQVIEKRNRRKLKIV